MVKRAKLTLAHTEVEEEDFSESVVTEQSVAPDSQGKLGKIMSMGVLTIVSLIIFRQKFF